jgi:pyruvate/2-oxoglutarate dehydrogenase complex dihydrolipoamide dehydrogenase (E3) component
MDNVKNIIIGFGKAGKTLAQDLGKRGESTLLIEKDPKMYGGTCINVACIPTKKLLTLAENKPYSANEANYYKNSIQEKKDLIHQLNQANYNNVQETENVEVIDGEASFINENEVVVKLNNGGEVNYKADRIFINTGSRPFIPPVDGLKIDGEFIHTSETIMEDEEFPEKLTIIGDGNIGLEFAAIFNQFGSEVTVISNQPETNFLPFVDADIADEVLETLKNMGIHFMFDTDTTRTSKSFDHLELTYKHNGSEGTLTTDKILVATGRYPNVDSLNLEAAGVILAEDGSIQVNKHLQTNIKHIFAMGDVKGGMQQTYISLDDYRVVRSFLFEDAEYTLAERKNIPASTFITPPLSMVGLSENDAREAGYTVKVAKLPVKSVPKAKILSQTEGIYKAVIDAENGKILGTVLFGAESHEVINIISTAMKAEMKYTDLANQVFTHPTMAEALNDLFGAIE